MGRAQSGKMKRLPLSGWEAEADKDDPMTHDQFKTHLSEYIDCELSGDLRAEMETHLDACEECRVLFVTTQKVIELSREQVAPKLSQAFVDELTERVKRSYRLGNRCEG
jgi:anti-sigma factor RsiW